MTAPRIPVTTLALEVGVCASGMHRKVRSLGIEPRLIRTGGRVQSTVTAEEAEAVRASYGDLTTDLSGWYTTAEATRLLGLTRPVTFTNALLRGRYTIERRRLLGQGRAVVYRYHPGQVDAYAAQRPVRPPSIPRGTLSTFDLTRITGCRRNTASLWATDGAPHGRTARGFIYFRPAELLAWLLARPGQKPCQRQFAARLGRHLTQERAA